MGYLAPGYVPQRKLFDEMYFNTITQWGGGYPRPQIEMMECKYQVTDPNAVPMSYIQMKPDLSLADLLYEKQQLDLNKRKNMFQEVNQFEQKRKAIEMTQQMLKFAVQKQALAEGIPPRTPFTPADQPTNLPFKTAANDPEINSPIKQSV